MKHKRDILLDISGRQGEQTHPPVPEPNAVSTRVFASLSDRARTPHRIEERNIIMRHRNWKAALVAIAAVFALAIGANAATEIFPLHTSTSSSIPAYASLPTAETCLRDAGFTPVLLARFSNGYTFADGTIVQNMEQEADGTTTDMSPSFHFTYTKGTDAVYLAQYQDLALPDETPYTTLGDTPLYYTSIRHKLVPYDYTPTAEEAKAEADGTLSFGYGDADMDISESTVQTLTWSTGELTLVLYQTGSNLSVEDLMSMASELLAN